MQCYTFEPIPKGMVVLFRETEEDPYWCQHCGRSFWARSTALRHGKSHIREKGVVKTITSQKPISSATKQEHRRESRKVWQRLNREVRFCGRGSAALAAEMPITGYGHVQQKVRAQPGHSDSKMITEAGAFVVWLCG